jgi:hypothetical protein
MADIFISYRRGETDTWIAGRLADRLTDSFDVFFDGNRESIDFGSSFPEEINEALAECLVVFAVIGPDWLEAANLARLKDEDDWVRRELRTALNKRQIRVVPLLVEADAPPDPSLLPRDLETLAQKQASRLDPNRWETDCGDLERRLREWLSKKPTPSSEPRLSIPPGLPFLCDRRDQEDAFVDLVQSTAASTGFIACVVHGHKWESHDELLERFRSEGVLDDVFHSVEEGAACYPIQLNRTRLKAGRFADALKSAIKADVLQRRSIPDSELAALFRTLARPLVVIVQLTWSDCRDLGTGAVKNLVEAWQSLGVTATDGTAERLPHPALLWVNVTYDQPDHELPADMLHSPLPKLCSVEEGHIREWVGIERVKPFVSAKKNDLLNLASDARYCHTPGKLHMMRFADAVRDIIAASS